MQNNGLSEDFVRSLITETLEASQPGPWNITRHFMYTRLRGLLRLHDGSEKRCLSISHSADFAELLGLSQAHVTEANYPEHNMLCLGFPAETYDFCISDQVLEHIEGNPFTAFEESARVTKKGGYIAHTTCFINEIHNIPKDFWRFTPDALRLLAEHCDTTVMECGGWGNKEAWNFINLGFRWTGVPVSPSHPIHRMAMTNDDSVPIVTWVVSQKI